MKIITLSTVLAVTLLASASDSSKAATPPNYGVPNAIVVKNDKRIITLEAVGMGVAPECTISKAQAVAMAKRAAIVDAYRQMGEKLHGLKIESRERMVNMVLQDSVVNTRLNSLVKNASVVQSSYEDGLSQVRMELRIDGARWNDILTRDDYR